MKDIETGVDKLVKLIEQKKRVALDKAAKELGVSTVLVQEWADFLEEDGLISIDYSLSKVWLVEKKLSKKDVVKKEREYEGKKDSFLRKVETTMKTLDSDTNGFEEMKKEFSQLKSQIGGEIGFVQKELKELEHYENLKKSIDKDVEKQKEHFIQLMEQSHREIRTEEKKFQEMLSLVTKEKKKVSQEKKEILSLEAREQQLMVQLDQMNKSLSEIRKQIRDENDIIHVTVRHVDKLEKFVGNVESRLKSKKHEAIMPLVELSHQHHQKILGLQDDILKKLDEKKLEIVKVKKGTSKTHENLKKFFDKKEQAEKLLNKIELDKKNLQSEYETLMKKARAFNVVSKKSSVKNHIDELEAAFKLLDTHKFNLKKEMKELSKLLKN